MDYILSYFIMHRRGPVATSKRTIPPCSCTTKSTPPLPLYIGRNMAQAHAVHDIPLNNVHQDARLVHLKKENAWDEGDLRAKTRAEAKSVLHQVSYL